MESEKNTRNIVIIILGMICLAILGICATLYFERNPEEPEELTPWIGLPLVLSLVYLYMDNFSFVVYIMSIGVTVLMFI